MYEYFFRSHIEKWNLSKNCCLDFFAAKFRLIFHWPSIVPFGQVILSKFYHIKFIILVVNWQGRCQRNRSSLTIYYVRLYCFEVLPFQFLFFLLFHCTHTDNLARIFLPHFSGWIEQSKIDFAFYVRLTRHHTVVDKIIYFFCVSDSFICCFLFFVF